MKRVNHHRVSSIEDFIHSLLHSHMFQFPRDLGDSVLYYWIGWKWNRAWGLLIYYYDYGFVVMVRWWFEIRGLRVLCYASSYSIRECGWILDGMKSCRVKLNILQSCKACGRGVVSCKCVSTKYLHVFRLCYYKLVVVYSCNFIFYPIINILYWSEIHGYVLYVQCTLIWRRREIRFDWNWTATSIILQVK